MTHIVIRIFTTALALLVAAFIVPGIVVDGLIPALIAAVLLGLVNITIKPLLILLTLPITILTLGLFAFVINALMLWFVAGLVDGVTISGFIPALLGTLIVSVVSAAGNKLLD
jgi:putative membrane protein